jgi:DNA-binding transcriptional MerR regulator
MEISEMADEWLTKGEFAQLAGVSPVTVKAWANDGLVPVTRTASGVRLFRRAACERFLRERAARSRKAAPEVIGDGRK